MGKYLIKNGKAQRLGAQNMSLYPVFLIDRILS